MRLIGCTETLVTINLPCVTPQKSEYLIYTAAEAWHHTNKVFSNSSNVAYEPVLRKLRVSMIVGGEAE